MEFLLINVMQVTFCNIGKIPAEELRRCLGPAGSPPSEGQQAQNLPAQIRRQHQKPGDEVAISDFRAQRTEEIAVAKASIAAEYGFSDEIDNNRHDDQADKQKACE
jgi:hypothetical protein